MSTDFGTNMFRREIKFPNPTDKLIVIGRRTLNYCAGYCRRQNINATVAATPDENGVPLCIDRATFEAVQAEIERRANETTVKKGTTTVFTGTIRCGVCGKNYRRKTSKTGFVWICATFNTKGKKFCASKQIPEETLKSVCAEALDNARWSRAFSARTVGECSSGE